MGKGIHATVRRGWTGLPFGPRRWFVVTTVAACIVTWAASAQPPQPKLEQQAQITPEEQPSQQPEPQLQQPPVQPPEQQEELLKAERKNVLPRLLRKIKKIRVERAEVNRQLADLRQQQEQRDEALRQQETQRKEVLRRQEELRNQAARLEEQLKAAIKQAGAESKSLRGELDRLHTDLQRMGQIIGQLEREKMEADKSVKTEVQQLGEQVNGLRKDLRQTQGTMNVLLSQTGKSTVGSAGYSWAW